MEIAVEVDEILECVTINNYMLMTLFLYIQCLLHKSVFGLLLALGCEVIEL